MKKYILLFLILIFLIPLSLVFVKYTNVFRTTIISKFSVIKNESFLSPNNVKFPQGLFFSKAMSGSEGLGKGAIYYDYTPVAMDGTEWVATKEVNTETEYVAVINRFNTFYNLIVHKNGWTNEEKVNNHTIQPLAANSPAGQVFGYLKFENGNVQVVLFYHQKDNTNYPSSVQFRVFLSNVTVLNHLVK